MLGASDYEPVGLQVLRGILGNGCYCAFDLTSASSAVHAWNAFSLRGCFSI